MSHITNTPEGVNAPVLPPPIVAFVGAKTVLMNGQPVITTLITVVPDGRTRLQVAPQPADPGVDATTALILSVHHLVSSSEPRHIVIYTDDPKVVAHYHAWNYTLPPCREVKFVPREMNEATSCPTS